MSNPETVGSSPTIEVMLWIMSNPRSGTTILCELLNSTGLFPNFNHPNLHPVQGAFGEWLRLYNSPEDFERLPSPNLKCLYHQYVTVFKDVNKYNLNYIKAILPEVKFIHLVRENRLQHAVSLYFAQKTELYQIRNTNKLNEYLNKDIELDRKRLLSCYNYMNDQENRLNSFLYGHMSLRVKYDDLIINPASVLMQILDYCGINYSNEHICKSIEKCYGEEKQLFKMTHRLAERYVKILEEMVG